MIKVNGIDILIILIIIISGLIGYKRGFTRAIVSCLGIFLVVIFSFLLKNPISMILYEHLPFFKFGGVLKGVTALNIVLYEVIAFLLVMSILTIALKVVMLATTLFERLLKMTILLGIPSKICGMVVGILEGFIWIFIGLYIMSFPIFPSKIVSESKYATPILKNTPILSSLTRDTVKVIDEFIVLKDEYEVIDNADEFNLKAVDLLLKYNIVTVESVEKLVEKKKLQIIGIEDVIQKYKLEEKK